MQVRSPPPEEADTISWRWLGAIGALAALLRVVYVCSIAHLFCFQQPQTEGGMYLRWTQQILSGHAPAAPFDEAPGYPYWLAGIGATLGDGPGVAAGAQVVLGAATCLLLASLSARLSGSRRTGIIAGFAAALCGPLITATGEIAPTTLFLFVLAAGLYMVERSGTLPRSAANDRRWVVAAALWGIAVVIRSETVVGAVIVIWYAARRGGRRAAALLTAGFALPIVLSVALNASSGHFVPLNYGGGLNFFLGNNPASDGVDPFQDRTASQTIAAAMTAANGDPVRADRRLWREGLSYWRHAPVAALTLVARKAIWTLHDRDLPNTTDPVWWQHKSVLFATPVRPPAFGFFLVLALVGLVVSAPLLRSVRARVLLAPLAIGVVTCVVFFTNGRFRAPILLPVLFASAVGLEALGRVQPRKVLAASCAVAAIGGLVTFGNWSGVREYHLGSIDVNLGICERADGNDSAAVPLLSRGLELEPMDGLGWMHLAQAYDDLGRRSDAITVVQTHAEALASVDPAIKDSFARRLGLNPEAEAH